MLFERKTPVGGYEVIKRGEEDTIRVNYEQEPKVPSIENDQICMAATVDKLVEVPSATKIMFFQRRNYRDNTY